MSWSTSAMILAFRFNISSDAECRALYARECEKSWDSLMREAGAGEGGTWFWNRDPTLWPGGMGFRLAWSFRSRTWAICRLADGGSSVDALSSIFSDIYGACGLALSLSVFIRNSKNEFVELAAEGIAEFS